MEMAQR